MRLEQSSQNSIDASATSDPFRPGEIGEQTPPKRSLAVNSTTPLKELMLHCSVQNVDKTPPEKQMQPSQGQFSLARNLRPVEIEPHPKFHSFHVSRPGYNASMGLSFPTKDTDNEPSVEDFNNRDHDELDLISPGSTPKLSKNAFGSHKENLQGGEPPRL